MQTQHFNQGQPKQRTKTQQVKNTPSANESETPASLMTIKSWCANPDSCLTDCKTYCKKLKPVK